MIDAVAIALAALAGAAGAGASVAAAAAVLVAAALVTGFITPVFAALVLLGAIYPDGVQSLPAPVYAGCVLLGLSVGNMVTLPSVIVQAEFPREAFGRVISLLLSINQVTFAFGPVILGALRDWSSDYAAAFALCLALQVIATAVVLFGRRQHSG